MRTFILISMIAFTIYGCGMKDVGSNNVGQLDVGINNDYQLVALQSSSRAVGFVYSGEILDPGLQIGADLSAQRMAAMLRAKGLDVNIFDHSITTDNDYLLFLLSQNKGVEKLFIYIVSHGVNSGLCLRDGEACSKPLGWLELSNAIRETGAKNVTVIIDSCNSGDAIHYLSGVGRIIVATSRIDSPAYIRSDGTVFEKSFNACMNGGDGVQACVERASVDTSIYWQKPIMTVN